MKEIKNPPKNLYVIGNAELLNKPSIAIVGSRKASEYGKKYAALFAKSIACSNITVVSGLAIGIDSIAHENSITEIGKTVAVIASGFSHIFPKENISLFQKIIKNGGCVISEYPPETQINMQTFPSRNRIIAGLSMAVLVIEAKFRSGSGITARYAMEQKKQVLCIPHSLEDKNGAGCNRLLKKGAKLLTEEIELEKYLGIKLQKSEIQNGYTYCKEKLKIEKEYQDIYKILLQHSKTSSQIAQKLNIPISIINQMLTIMEIKGYIQALPGNEYTIKKG